MAIKEALKQIKAAGEEKSATYLKLIKKLAHVSFLNNKYSESEKYFKVSVNVAENFTQNPQNIFLAKKNLVALYMRTDLKKARDVCGRLKTDAESLALAPVHQKELAFMMASLCILERDFKKGKEELRNCLKMNFDPRKSAQILNNLAYASWQQCKHLDKQKKSADLEEERDQTDRDKQYIISWLKEALQKHEQFDQQQGAGGENLDVDRLQALFELTSLDN